MLIRSFGYLLILVLYCTSAVSQWSHFTNPDFIQNIEIDGNYIWCGTLGGVVRYCLTDNTVRVFTSLDGLPGTSIPRIIASNENMWACIGSMVYKFDGDHFVALYKEKNSPRSLDVWDVDNDGNHWGIDYISSIWCLMDGSWKELTPDFISEENIKLTCLAVGHDNTIWFGHKGGVLSYDGDTWSEHDLDYGGSVFAISIGPEGEVWIAGDEWLAQFNGSSWVEHSIEGFSGSSISVDNNGTVWAGAGNALWRFDSKIIEKHVINDNLEYMLGIRGIAAGNNGEIWFFQYHFIERGLFCFDGDEVKKVSFQKSILHNRVRAVAVDRNNTLLAGSFADIVLCACPVNSGLSCFDGMSWIDYTVENGLAGNRITDIVVDKNNEIWIAAYQDGLSHYDGVNWNTHLTDAENDKILPAYVSTLAVSANNTIWAGTIRDGLFSYNGEIWTQYTEENSTIKGDVFSIAIAPDDDLWVTSMAGVSSFNGEQWNLFTVEDGLPDPYTSKIAVDSKNNNWIGLYPYNNYDYDPDRGGIVKYDGESWTHFTENDGLVCNRVTTIAVDDDDNIWIGTCEGLSFYNGNSFKNWTVENGLSDNYIYDIAFDSNGLVWIGTEKGLCCYHSLMHVFVEKSEKMLQPNISITGIFPNPFNMTTFINIILNKPAYTYLSIYNTTGQKVRTLVSERLNGGHYCFTWDGLNDDGGVLSAGPYFVNAGSADYRISDKLMLIK